MALPRLPITATAPTKTLSLLPIRRTSTDQVSEVEAKGRRREDLFVVEMGPPCQPHSPAGKRGGGSDPRGGVYFECVRKAMALGPKYIVVENVRGFRTSALAKGGEKGSFLAEAERILDEGGWKHRVEDIDAVDVGSASHRHRVVLFAWRDGTPPARPFVLTHGEGRSPYRTFGDATAGLVDKEVAKVQHDRIGVLWNVPEGGCWKDLPPEHPSRLHLEELQKKTGGGMAGYFRRLSRGKPSPTITKSPGGNQTFLGHPTEQRVVSVEECKRFLDVPDDFVLCGSTEDKYNQLGNTVTGCTSKAIWECIRPLETVDSGGKTSSKGSGGGGAVGNRGNERGGSSTGGGGGTTGGS